MSESTLIERIEAYFTPERIAKWPKTKSENLLCEALQELKELQLRVSDTQIRGMLTRLERDHHELRAAWENETGKPWAAAIERDLER